MKKLYILTENMGDGSNSLNFSLDRNIVDQWQAAADNDLLDYTDPGMDGDGFGYTTLTVPDDTTYESLGLHDFQVLAECPYQVNAGLSM